MRIIITGGAGFIGCNAAQRFRERGDEVVVVDDLSRRGTASNLEWLEKEYGVEFARCDIRNYPELLAIFRRNERAEAVVHLAGQVAVTTSVTNPRNDFEINALGTFNVLEAIRESGSKPMVVFASTNKVYGGMETVATEKGPGYWPEEREGRYRYRDLPMGIPEDQLLDFHSPYGCSKGAADQYVRDYARIYDFPTAVLRQSCIYGPRQFGIEDQGWVAWFAICAVMGRQINLYGDGLQVRDMLHVSDLMDAYEAVIEKRSQCTQGKIYNVGGGPGFTFSILGLVHKLESILGREIPRKSFDWRPGDQPVYISDIRKAEAELGWRPRIDPESGTRQLVDWIQKHRDLIGAQLGDLLA